MQLLADLHIHTVLSPCAAEQMTPAAIVRRSLECNLSMIAICDHNAAANTEPTQQAAGELLAVLAGIEITTCEEAHVVGLFPTSDAAQQASAIVRKTLPELATRAKWMGPQAIMDSSDRVVGNETKMLSSACSLTLEQTVALIHEHSGIAIAAHVDRPSFSIPSQLGMIPDGLALDALDVSPAGVRANKHSAWTELGIPVLCSSDAHSLDEIGDGRVELLVQSATFDELVLALRGQGDRRCRIA